MELSLTEVGKSEEIWGIIEFHFVHIKVKMYIRYSVEMLNRDPVI